MVGIPAVGDDLLVLRQDLQGRLQGVYGDREGSG
jgi:hypothetical protein